MERIDTLGTLVRAEFEELAEGRWAGAKPLLLVDHAQRIFTLLAVCPYPRNRESAIVGLARLVGDTVIIEEDISDRPLYERLMQKGVPREKIILTYAGEPAPDASSTS